MMAAALSELRPDSAVVLPPDPATSASSVPLRMARVNGNRLIVKFDPV
jgi:hypothetical protein